MSIGERLQGITHNGPQVVAVGLHAHNLLLWAGLPLWKPLVNAGK